MIERKKTEVFPPHIKPVRVGVYEVALTKRSFNDRAAQGWDLWFAYWDGNSWGYMASNPHMAARPANACSLGGQHKWWRGLEQHPNDHSGREAAP